jgi:serine/threonine protein kinase
VRKLGKYIVGPTLGEGGYSKVKLGTHEVTGEKVALKILQRKAFSANSSERKQVEREIAAMKAIQHRNVIQLKFVDWDAQYEKKDGTKTDIILVVLELATGGELFEFLSFTGAFEEKIARTYFHQLIAGIGYCHSQGVVHRDLKPENLLMDQNFLLKLADFGFSRVFNPDGDAKEKVMQTECGTTGYMAPEMFRGFDRRKQGYDATATDVWACGVILFIMLAGFPPFQKPNASDWWFDKLMKKNFKAFWSAHCRSAKFSEEAKDLLIRILNPDPVARITVEGITKHDWYNDKTISESDLAENFGKKKKIIDAENRKLKSQKQQESGGTLEQEMVKDLGDSGHYDDNTPPP